MSEPEPTPSVTDEVVTVRVRRAPKYGVFLLLGAVVGILAAMILTFAFHGTDDVSPNKGLEYSTMQVFGFVTLICVPVGIALAGVVALILDRVVGRRSREVRVDHETVRRAE
jgi:uncharacterized membrane protein